MGNAWQEKALSESPQLSLEEVRCHSNPMIRSPITVNAIKILHFTYRLYSPLADGWNKEYAGSGCACKQYVLTVSRSQFEQKVKVSSQSK